MWESFYHDQEAVTINIVAVQSPWNDDEECLLLCAKEFKFTWSITRVQAESTERTLWNEKTIGEKKYPSVAFCLQLSINIYFYYNVQSFHFSMLAAHWNLSINKVFQECRNELGYAL